MLAPLAGHCQAALGSGRSIASPPRAYKTRERVFKTRGGNCLSHPLTLVRRRLGQDIFFVFSYLA